MTDCNKCHVLLQTDLDRLTPFVVWPCWGHFTFPAMAQRQHGHHPPGRPVQQVQLWADLLADLDHGEPAISTSAREMAEDVPPKLRKAVNHELERRGCGFRISA